LRLLMPGMVKLGRFDPEIPLLGFLLEGIRILLMPGMVKLGRFDPVVPLVLLRGIGNRLVLFSPLRLSPRIPELVERDRDALGVEDDRLDAEIRGVLRPLRCLDEDRLAVACLEDVARLERVKFRVLLVLAGALLDSCARIALLAVTFLGVSAAAAGSPMTVPNNRTVQAARFVILPSIVVAPWIWGWGTTGRV